MNYRKKPVVVEAVRERTPRILRRSHSTPVEHDEARSPVSLTLGGGLRSFLALVTWAFVTKTGR